MKAYAGVTALLAFAGAMSAQTSVDLTRQGKVASGTQLPGQCKRGQLYLKSDAPAGSNLYVCTEDNTWTPPLPYVGGVGVTVAGNAVEIEDAVIPVYYTGAGAPSLNCSAGRDYYVDTTAGVLYYCAGAGQWRAVVTGQANTYGAGQRQSMTHNTTDAGLRIVPADGDPANAQDGDLWYNRTTGKFRRRQNGTAFDWDSVTAAHPLLGGAHSDTAAGTPQRGDVITGQGSTAAWTRLPLGASGSYLRSNGTDLAYARIATSDLPAGYGWSNLAGVPAMFPPSAHAASHQNGGGDEVATATPGANAIPKAGPAGTLAASWIPTLNQNTTGNAATATALAAAPSQCGTGTYPSGVDARGNAQNCAAVSGAGTVTNAGGGLTAGQLLIGNGGADLKTGNLSGDCSTSGDTSITCTKTNGVAYAASATTDTTNAANISSGTLSAARLPAPTATTPGGVRSKDCSGAGHVLKIQTDGSVTCSADAGGSGVALTAGLGALCFNASCNTQTQGVALTQNAVYYLQVIVPYTMTVKQFAARFTPLAGGASLASAMMDSSCSKVPGSDNVGTYTGTSITWTLNNVSSSAPTLTPGVYYVAWGTDASGTSIQAPVYVQDYFYFGFYDTTGAGGNTNYRFFTGSNAMTGAGATLAIPSTCGAKAKVSMSFAPAGYLVP